MEKREFKYLVVYFDGRIQCLAGATYTFEDAVEFARKREELEGARFNVLPVDEKLQDELRNLIQGGL